MEIFLEKFSIYSLVYRGWRCNRDGYLISELSVEGLSRSSFILKTFCLQIQVPLAYTKKKQVPNTLANVLWKALFPEEMLALQGRALLSLALESGLSQLTNPQCSQFEWKLSNLHGNLSTENYPTASLVIANV